MTATSALNVLLLGGCRPRQSVYGLSQKQNRVNFEPYSQINGTNNIGDMLQTIAFLRGEIEIPQEFRFLCKIPPSMTPMAGTKDFSNLDAAVLELSTPIDFVFRGLSLNHFRFRRTVYAPIRELDAESGKLLGKWVRAVKEGDEKAREEASVQLVDRIPDTLEQAELVRALVRETRSRRVDIAAGLERICGILGCPVGVVLYFFRYMPDGRAVDWPPGFAGEVIDAANRLGLPTFDPTPTLLEFGIERAFREDQEFHYVPRLRPIMGEQMIRFAESICQRGAADRSADINVPIPA